MRTYRTKTIPAQPAREEKVLAKRLCDLCKAPAANAESWATGYYEIDKTIVELRYENGSVYPEGGQSTTTSFDICPECFKSKLVPFLESLGAKVGTENTDW